MFVVQSHHACIGPLRMMRVRLLLRAVLVLALLGGVLLHAAPAAQSMRVIVVLNDPAVDPNYTVLGATVEERWSEHRVVRIDGAALAKLAGDPAVRYVQHIEGEPAFTAEAEKPPAAKLGDPAVAVTPPTWFSGEYRYDAAGNITAIGAPTALYADGKQTLNGDSKSNAYYYDSVGRLLQAEVNNATNATESYRYDSFGNLIERTRTASSQSVTNSISVSTATNRVDSASYDAAGNLTSWTVTGETYDYDAANMVISKRASSTSAAETYLYTADDERVATRRTDSTWHWTVRDFDGKVLREYESASDSPSATWAWVEDYVYRDGTLFAATRPTAQGGTRHFHLDHLGTARLITDSSGRAIAVHDYFPYGSEQTAFNQEITNRAYDRPEPMTFTGHERDYTEGTAVQSENFVDYMHARYYRAAWGRFLTVDPASGQMNLPQSWNRYVYARNSPLAHTDPTGRCTDSIVCLNWGKVEDAVTVTAPAPPQTTVQDLTATDLAQGMEAVANAYGPDFAELSYTFNSDGFSFGEPGMFRGVAASSAELNSIFGAAPEYAYHYTFATNAPSILENGLFPGSYLTPNGTLTPMQAQIDLALPPNRGLTDTVLRVNLSGLRDAGYAVPEPAPVGRMFNMPGGGEEIVFPESIPPEFIEIVPPF